MNRFKFLQYKEVVLYILFGICTTFINLLTFYVLYGYCKFPNVLSNMIAWVISVLFAYTTNKKWVFSVNTWTLRGVAREIFYFVIFRLITGALDLAIMYVMVDIYKFNAYIMKIISNAVVILLNYLVSKIVIFKKN